MTPDEIETLEELKRHYALRMGSGTRYYDALRAALRDAAALSRPAPSDALALRHAWEAGFRLCRSYGDNHHHFDGEQKERKWRDYIEGLAAPAQVAAPAPETPAGYHPAEFRAETGVDWSLTHERCPKCGDTDKLGGIMALGKEDGSRWCLKCRVRLEAFAPEMPAPDAMPEKRGHQIVARDRDGMPWCGACRKWGVREDGPCDRTYPGSDGRRQEAQP